MAQERKRIDIVLFLDGKEKIAEGELDLGLDLTDQSDVESYIRKKVMNEETISIYWSDSSAYRTIVVPPKLLQRCSILIVAS